MRRNKLEHMRIDNELKKAQNEEAAREHLRGARPETAASSSADTHASRNFIPPNDDSYTGVNKKVKGKQKGSRASKKQISDLKKMNEEMKKSIEETIDEQDDEPMREESPVIAKKEKEKTRNEEFIGKRTKVKKEIDKRRGRTANVKPVTSTVVKEEIDAEAEPKPKAQRRRGRPKKSKVEDDDDPVINIEEAKPKK